MLLRQLELSCITSLFTVKFAWRLVQLEKLPDKLLSPEQKVKNRKRGRLPGAVHSFQTGQHFHDLAVKSETHAEESPRQQHVDSHQLRMLRPDCVLIKQIKVSAQPLGRLLAAQSLFFLLVLLLLFWLSNKVCCKNSLKSSS